MGPKSGDLIHQSMSGLQAIEKLNGGESAGTSYDSRTLSEIRFLIFLMIELAQRPETTARMPISATT